MDSSKFEGFQKDSGPKNVDLIVTQTFQFAHKLDMKHWITRWNGFEWTWIQFWLLHYLF